MWMKNTRMGMIAKVLLRVGEIIHGVVRQTLHGDEQATMRNCGVRWQEIWLVWCIMFTLSLLPQIRRVRI